MGLCTVKQKYRVAETITTLESIFVGQAVLP